jgi:hypothetical protein
MGIIFLAVKKIWRSPPRPKKKGGGTKTKTDGRVGQGAKKRINRIECESRECSLAVRKSPVIKIWKEEGRSKRGMPW